MHPHCREGHALTVAHVTVSRDRRAARDPHCMLMVPVTCSRDGCSMHAVRSVRDPSGLLTPKAHRTPCPFYATGGGHARALTHVVHRTWDGGLVSQIRVRGANGGGALCAVEGCAATTVATRGEQAIS